jgi:tRNA-binding EMAP/Myf-like protein
MLVDEVVDVTATLGDPPAGSRHPLTTIQERIGDMFVAMGWEIAEGPEIEAEWLNFDALNLGPDHPARSMQDTFFLDPPETHLLLRTHTSRCRREPADPTAAGVRTGARSRVPHRRARRDPLAGVPPGRGTRRGPGITMAHLKGTLDHFAGRCSATVSTPGSAVVLPLHRAERRGGPALLRLPGTATCRGQLPHLQGRGLDRVGGCGVVNPRVLVACGVDPDEFTGFAFGMGIDRTLMFRHGSRTCVTWPRVTSASPAPSGWTSDARPGLVDPRLRALPADVAPGAAGRPAHRPRAEARGAQHSGADVSGPLVVGRVLSRDKEEHKNGKAINWCRVDVGPEHNPSAAAESGEDSAAGRGIVCGAHNFDAGDLVVVALPGAGAPGRVRDLGSQDVRPRVRRDDLLGGRARPR